MTARTRNIRHTAKPRVGKYVALMVLIIMIAMAAAFVTAGVSLMKSWLQDLPDYTDTDSYLLSQPTRILDADGNVIAEYYSENRVSITIDQCSQYVLDATVDTEDERFYSHNGIDMKGILRAVVAQLTGGSEGASTITQQLVRNTVLKDEQFEKTLSRKVREAYIALELEKMYSKDEILMMYLNSIYYGQNCYGIEAAAETYFGKTCSELTIAEAATLAGLPQSPSAYDPTLHPDLAVERRNVVLAHMLDCGHITQAEYDDAVAQPLRLNYTARTAPGAFSYPYFVDYVLQQLSKQFAGDTILKGGLTVKTTISPATQQAAEDAVNSVIGDRDDGLQAALVAIDPSTGYIVAMVGGSDYSQSQYNLATQAKRQPGSSFKVFTLVAAIQAGMNPEITINANGPLTIGDWTVNNINYDQYGVITLRTATKWSSNVVYAQVIDAIGAQNVADVAYAMGITTDLGYIGNVMTLGTSEITVLDMASAFSTLASGGTHRDPVCITEVLDRHGNVIYQSNSAGTQVLTSQVAMAVTDVLEDDLVGDGTGVEAHPSVDQPVAGKTGTTDDYCDLWFVGYTPQLSCAVWVGYDTRTRIDGDTHTLPNPIFANFMTAALSGLERQEWPMANAGSPSYLDNSTWTMSDGTQVYTYVAPVVEETTTTDTTTTTDGTATNGDGTGTTTDGTTYNEPTTDGGGAADAGDGGATYDVVG